MDPLTLASLGLAGLGAVGKGAAAYGERSGLLSKEQEDRLRELERLQAINMLGGDYNAALGKHMSPVQGAMREAREQMAQDVSSQDISGGSYFRGQQALTEAAAQERAMAEQGAREAIRQEEEMRMKEMEDLRERERLEAQKWAAGFGAVAESLGSAAPSLMNMALAQKEKDALILAAGGKLTPAQSKEGVEALIKYQTGGMSPAVLPKGYKSWADVPEGGKRAWIQRQRQEFLRGGAAKSSVLYGRPSKLSLDELYPDPETP